MPELSQLRPAGLGGGQVSFLKPDWENAVPKLASDTSGLSQAAAWNSVAQTLANLPELLASSAQKGQAIRKENEKEKIQKQTDQVISDRIQQGALQGMTISPDGATIHIPTASDEAKSKYWLARASAATNPQRKGVLYDSEVNGATPDDTALPVDDEIPNPDRPYSSNGVLSGASAETGPDESDMSDEELPPDDGNLAGPLPTNPQAAQPAVKHGKYLDKNTGIVTLYDQGKPIMQLPPGSNRYMPIKPAKDIPAPEDAYLAKRGIDASGMTQDEKINAVKAEKIKAGAATKPSVFLMRSLINEGVPMADAKDPETGQVTNEGILSAIEKNRADDSRLPPLVRKEIDGMAHDAQRNPIIKQAGLTNGFAVEAKAAYDTNPKSSATDEALIESYFKTINPTVGVSGQAIQTSKDFSPFISRMIGEQRWNQIKGGGLLDQKTRDDIMRSVEAAHEAKMQTVRNIAKGAADTLKDKFGSSVDPGTIERRILRESMVPVNDPNAPAADTAAAPAVQTAATKAQAVLDKYKAGDYDSNPAAKSRAETLLKRAGLL